MYLYEKIETLKEAGAVTQEIPSYIINNLNPELSLREYQKQAFINYIYYYENPNLKRMPTQNLFHMATGSGKTLIMAGLILYLYKKGYRNFLFFVNSTTIIKKTKDNFLNNQSIKYLFNNQINIETDNVNIREVTNFQDSNKDDINICFQTIQGLHYDLLETRENGLSFDDFENNKVVLISDEAHHLNALSDAVRIDKDEKELLKTWEYTVEKIFRANNENVLLEFTATCDVQNEYISSKYVDKIIFNYPLSEFRKDGYSKEISTLQTDVDMKTKMLQAVLTSQYRLKLFQDNKIDIKPVILFKSAKVDDSKENMSIFKEMIKSLTEADLLKIKENTNSEILMNIFIYFEENDLKLSNIVQEIKEDFGSDNKCLSVNSDEEAEKVQILVNTLERKDNTYRAIFEVKKLDEGWDVLNLFDIVRLYETRDGGSKIGKKTIQEAQLIGRGARYCPFVIDSNQDKYKRKYDMDIENPLRICETLLYHCQYDVMYISELRKALKEIGLDPKTKIQVNLKLKDEFKQTDFYRNGLVFYNKRKIIDRKKIENIPLSIIQANYDFNFSSWKSGTTKLLTEAEENLFRDIEIKTRTISLKVKNIAEKNYNLVLTALRKISVYKFSILKQFFPNLKSMREFIMSDNYLGNITINITSVLEIPTNEMIYNSVLSMLNKIKDSILKMDEVYEGTTLFESKRVYEIFGDKVLNITDPDNDSVGIPQSRVDDEKYRLDVPNCDWYVFNDNFGTTEEKRFVKYFSRKYNELKENYSQIYLIRNERAMHLYTFENGERFEPDYILMLISDEEPNPIQYQVFIEPKGTIYLDSEKFKEDFLRELNVIDIDTETFYTENLAFKILGMPFYNEERKLDEFDSQFERLINL